VIPCLMHDLETTATLSGPYHLVAHDFRHQLELSDTITPARLSRTDVSACQRQVDELQNGLAKPEMRKENEKNAFKFY
jgi:hypothetical protein